ncbi:hypothetical protein CK203_097081 [Vitis vinifera]|uniref:Retrotransposon Copia-like N-terminal domain-containing protein n=1 Tax=Vitis vinifera TaxID=29760 RepID=A0A438FJU6_VITVI|nr:hypothetical protein CK203_097081 [Vitis vinifera]
MMEQQPSNGGKLDAANPYFLHHSDHPGMVLVSKPLNGENYSTWCRAMTISLNAKSKLGFIDGTTTMPSATDKPDEHASWKKCNDMILSWILNSLSQDLADSVIFSTTAQEIRRDIACLTQDQMTVAAVETQSTNPKANAAASGLLQTLLHLYRLIIDSGATDHITSSPTLLVNSSKNTLLPPVAMPSGEQAPITSIGNLPLNSAATLKNVLGVPSFKDLTTRTTIGLGEQRDGLYYLVALASESQKLKLHPQQPLLAVHPVLRSPPPPLYGIVVWGICLPLD